jgi:ABC-2 type transport system permease protein
VVAHLVRLKLQLLRNGLRRSPAALIGIALGLIYGGGLLVLGVAGLVALRFQPDLELTRAATTLGGAALIAAWALVPVLVFGTDPTLDPVRFATFAVPERQLATGLAVAGLVGLPGAATALLVGSTVVTWSHTVPGVLAAAVGGVAALATCVLLSRTITAAAASVLSTRRGRDVLAVAGFVALLGIGPLVSLAGGLGLSPADLGGVTTAVGWSPLGWAWAAPADLVQGDWAAGLARLTLALLLASVLLLAWQRQLAAAVRNPRGASATSDTGGHAGLGLLGRLPGTALGAVAARSAIYWRRDPRLNFPALITVLMPAGLLFPGLAGGGSELALVAMPLASAYMLGWGQHNDVGYDSTAFWLHVATGVDGVSDRVGRLFPSMVLGAVCVPSYAVLGAALAGRWDLLPASLGVSLALLLSGFALAALTSAIKQYPVPGPGESPFATPPGGAGITLLVQAAVGLGVLMLSLPALVLGTLAWFGHGWAAWAALVVGPAMGAAAMVVGVRRGAALFERRGPELLQDLVRTR